MNIEIAEPGRMTQTGSSLMRLIQNNDMPILDLLVRESIQNSLDAYRIDEKYVEVDFSEGSFESREFHEHLEGITEGLNLKYPDKEYKYIAIKDSNTVGLTGELHYDMVRDNNYGNLLKLVYEISKPQENLGSGGSWGLGKTVYFRLGAGIVVYYSRISGERDNYESRLAVSLVEDERAEGSLIPAHKGYSKRGIAWWGERIGENKTRPITDETEIKKVLELFGISPYTGDKTGTTVIIPYIDIHKLLSDNIYEYGNSVEEKHRPYWEYSLSEYIKISIQRWYAPRLNNTEYKYGKWLRASVNREGITENNTEKFYKLVKWMYNCADAGKILDNNDFKMEELKFKQVNIRKDLHSEKAGTAAYIKITGEELLQLPPGNKPTPYMFINSEVMDTDMNQAIVMFTRKPGMIVSYETTGLWADSIPKTDKNEYIICFFVLNSSNTLKTKSSMPLEEYIRRNELADHASWSDAIVDNQNLRIVSKIQQHIKKAVMDSYADSQPGKDPQKFNSGMSSFFGEKLLPPSDFGNRPTGDGQLTVTGKEKITVSNKEVMLNIDKSNIQYKNDYMEIDFNIKTKKGADVKSCNFIIGISTESGNIDPDKWETELGKIVPLKIQKSEMQLIKLNDDLINLDFEISDDIRTVDMEPLKIETIYTKNGILYGLSFYSEERLTYDISGKLFLKIMDSNIKTTFNIVTKGGAK